MQHCRPILYFFIFFLFFCQRTLVGAPLYTYIVADCATGKIITSKAADIRTYPASLTKMMTAILVFDAIREGQLSLNQKVRVSNYAAAQMPGKLWLKAGSTITIRDALHGMLIKSFNDCAVVLAEAVAGTENKFARRMNQRAAALGMRRTVFKNAAGVPNKYQVTTSHDMMLLARAFRLFYPEFYHIVGNTTWRYHGRIYHTTNRLLKTVKGVDGIKTGYVALSGFNLAISAERHGRRIIAVVMGGKNSLWRDKRMVELIEATFQRGGLRPFKEPRNQSKWVSPPHRTLQRFAQESDQRVNTPAKILVKETEPVEQLAENEIEKEGEIPIPNQKPDLFTQIQNGIYDTEITLALQDVEIPRDISLHKKPLKELEEPLTPPPPFEDEIEKESNNEVQSEVAKENPFPSKVPDRKEWGVQLGTYKSSESASDRAMEVQKNISFLQMGKIIVGRIHQDKKNLFCSRIMHLSESQALKACEELKEEGKGCVAIPDYRAPS